AAPEAPQKSRRSARTKGWSFTASPATAFRREKRQVRFGKNYAFPLPSHLYKAAVEPISIRRPFLRSCYRNHGGEDLYMNETTPPLAGTEHWTSKGEVKLFLWNKCAGDPARAKASILFVHGSSMASQPTFDLDVRGRPNSSAMEFFARHGYDTWS